MTWTLDEIAAATGGRASGGAEIARVVIDSRTARPGDLFVALRGEHRDGHEYVSAALAAGASAAVVREGRLPEGAAGIEVADPLEALRALAVWHRRDLEATVVAITGSTGKTTTKDLTAAVLGPSACSAPGSYNNEIGVPLTVLRAPRDARYLVVEAGSRGRGHIALMAPAIRPDVAVITGIGAAHLEMFGDLEAVREAKWELVEALQGNGVAVLPSDEPTLIRRHRGAVVTFGEGPSADVTVAAIEVDSYGCASFTMGYEGRSMVVHMASAGIHQARNAAASVAAGIAVGVAFEAAVDRVARAAISEWRMEVHPGDITVVNDAYNANPVSMESALRTVAAMPGRHLAALGMMHELGEGSAEAHRAVGRQARSLGFDTVVVVGADPGIAEGAGSIARSAADAEEAARLLRALLRPGDVLLVKASRAVGLEELADGLAPEVAAP